VLLARDCCKDLQALAEKADALMALHLPQGYDVTVVAPVTDDAVPGSEEELAAAIQKGGKKKKKWAKKKKQQDEIKSPLCHFHITVSA
jgi:hypothetical protein